jgi:histidyl-tRNA synthetase
MSKPSNPQGTRDFAPAVMYKRNYLISTIRIVFQKYGFVPLETPALEKLDVLTGKYGNEGDKLLYKIRSNKDIRTQLSNADTEKLNELLTNKFIPSDSSLGLRYDLTVPFARFVVQHRNEITTPFRRYQIQPVWRADRPQKGRFREFLQCDADCIGSKSLINEADLIRIYNEVFQSIGLAESVVRVNHRKLLEAMVEESGIDIDVMQFTTTLDKLDKIGENGVMNELNKQGLSDEQTRKLFTYIFSKPLNRTTIEQLRGLFEGDKASKALNELEELCMNLSSLNFEISVQLDTSLARGLDYYTGCIFEAVVPNSGIGSISGGGRYDDLTGVFGLKDMSGVGISFGIDRIYEILEARNAWPAETTHQEGVLLCHFSDENRLHAQKIAGQLRNASVNCLVYPDQKKIGKQLDYANKVGYQWVIVVGDREMNDEVYALKNLSTGEQTNLSTQDIIKELRGSV